MNIDKPKSKRPTWQIDEVFFPELAFIQPEGDYTKGYRAIVTRKGLGTVHEHYSIDKNCLMSCER